MTNLTNVTLGSLGSITSCQEAAGTGGRGICQRRNRAPRSIAMSAIANAKLGARIECNGDSSGGAARAPPRDRRFRRLSAPASGTASREPPAPDAEQHDQQISAPVTVAPKQTVTARISRPARPAPRNTATAARALRRWRHRAERHQHDARERRDQRLGQLDLVINFSET